MFIGQSGTRLHPPLLSSAPTVSGGSPPMWTLLQVPGRHFLALHAVLVLRPGPSAWALPPRLHCFPGHPSDLPLPTTAFSPPDACSLSQTSHPPPSSFHHSFMAKTVCISVPPNPFLFDFCSSNHSKTFLAKVSPALKLKPEAAF